MRKVKSCGGAAEVQLIGQNKKDPQVAKLHGANHLQNRLFVSIIRLDRWIRRPARLKHVNLSGRYLVAADRLLCLR